MNKKKLKEILFVIMVIVMTYLIDSIETPNILAFIADGMLLIGIVSPMIIVIIRVFLPNETHRTMYLGLILFIGIQFIPHFTYINYGKEAYDFYRPSMASDIDFDKISDYEWKRLERFRSGELNVEDNENLIKNIRSKINSYPLRCYYRIESEEKIILIRIMNFIIGLILLVVSFLSGIVCDEPLTKKVEGKE